MESKDVVIITLTMIIFLFASFLIGQRKRKSPPNTNQVSPIESDQDAITKNKMGASVQRGAPQNKDYTEQITKARKFHQRSAIVCSLVTENTLYEPFNEMYSQIDEAYERYDTKKEEHTREEFIALFSKLFSIAKFYNTQKDILNAAEEIAKSIIEYYDNQIFLIFSGQPFENLSERYRLNADLRATQLTKISAIITNHFATVIAEAKDIEQRRIWLQSNFQTFVAVGNESFDWGSAARNIGAGALAAAHPFIGIPALIANFKIQADKERLENAQLSHYIELLDEFESKINSVRQQIIHATDKTKRYVLEKFQEINDSAISKILTDISAGGCEINHYFTSLNVKELEKIERKLLGEGT